MNKLLILFLVANVLISKAQTIIPDTAYFGTAPNWVRVITYRNAATTTFLPKSDTASLIASKYKLDSTATALAASVAATYQLKGTYATGSGTASGTNTGDNATNTQYSGLVTNANHTGDATGSTALTLATVNGNVGSFGSATQVGGFTVNGKGLVTAASNTTIQIAESQVTSLTTDLGLKANLASPTFTGTVNGITSAMVGLGNANNTSDANKPVSTAQQTALDLKANLISPVFTTPNIGTATGSITGNAATVTTNANSTGDVTSVGNATTIGANKVTNGMLAGSIAYGKLVLTGAILNADLAGSIAYSKLSLSGAILNTDLAGSIDLTTKVTGILPFANNAGTTATTSATTGTMTVSMTTPIITIVPSGACTFNGTGGVTGQRATFVVTTSGTSSFVLTWNTNYRTTATLATGTTTAKIFCVTFLCTNGTTWVEISRTTAM